MTRGFIPLVVVAIVGLVSALTAGGAYTVYKVNQLQKENEAIKTELQEQKQEVEEEVVTEVASTTEVVEEERDADTATVQEVQEEESTITPVENEVAVDRKYEQSEANAAGIIADYYEATALKTIDGQLELFDLTITEINRYLSGIPTIVNNLKSMLELGSFDRKAVTDAKSYFDDWGDDYINDFTDLKNRISQIKIELKNERTLLIQVSGELRTKYVPVSKSREYMDEIDRYNQQVDYWLDEIDIAMHQLTTRFIEDKDYVNEAVYNTVFDNIETPEPALPSYNPPSVNASVYKPPVSTFCENFGTSISCTSYQWY